MRKNENALLGNSHLVDSANGGRFLSAYNVLINVHKMRTTKRLSSVQLSLFPCQGSGVNDAHNANTIGKLSTYLKTRGGLCRLLMLFPGDTPVTEALRLAPSVLTNSRKEVAL